MALGTDVEHSFDPLEPQCLNRPLASDRFQDAVRSLGILSVAGNHAHFCACTCPLIVHVGRCPARPSDLSAKTQEVRVDRYADFGDSCPRWRRMARRMAQLGGCSEAPEADWSDSRTGNFG